jgi:tRNA A-37 threonylcarbamoyl transferase component Bud32
VGEDGGADLPSAVVPPDGVADAPEGYENLVPIDQGGSAVVYRALDTRFDRSVALKILRSERLDERQLRHFNAECLATGRVSSHPNIVTVYDAGTTRGHRPWLAMEYCSGGSLARELARTGPLQVADVISIGVRLCSALSAAHEAGILHRDVKPQNVLLTSYGEPALADFGIASRTEEDGTGQVATETAAYTVVHAAPELLQGNAATAAADIYSLGSTLYTLVAGQAPFAEAASTGLAPLVTRILRNEVPVIARPGVPQELERLLRTCMAAQPQDRPGSASEVGASLAALGRRLATAENATQRLPAARSGAASRFSARGLLVVLGAAMGVMLAAFTASGFSLAGSAALTPTGTPARMQTRTSARTDGQTAARTGEEAGPAQASDMYAPQELVVAPGHSRGQLIVTWRMPPRPGVVATVVYEGSGTARARAIVTYNSSRQGVHEATLSGLPAGRRVCVSAAHVVTVGDKVASAVSLPVCAVPR